MNERLFISYRRSDGTDKAVALARDLSRLYGAGRVFLDSDDLAGGSRWRRVISDKLDAKPIVLVLVTPHYLDALDADGRRRIDQDDDPVRAELDAALSARAELIPLLCDGLPCMPVLAGYPAPVQRLAERTWRPLRSLDWEADVARIVADLHALGLRATRPAASSMPVRRRSWLIGSAGLVAGVGAGAAWWWQGRRSEWRLGGPWIATIARRGAKDFEEAFLVHLLADQDGLRVRLTSEPVPIGGDADWTRLRAAWLEIRKTPLDHVIYRFDGRLQDDGIGAAPLLIAPLQIDAAGAQGAVDGGEFRGKVHESGRRIDGRLWLNSDQAERPMEMRRPE